MSIGEQLRKKTIEILENYPQGIRYGDLLKEAQNVFPGTMWNELDSNQTRKTKTKDKELAKIMINKKFIRQDQEEVYITAPRRLRNHYSHDLDFPQSLFKSIRYVDNCISLLKIYLQFLSKLNSPNEGE